MSAPRYGIEYRARILPPAVPGFYDLNIYVFLWFGHHGRGDY